MSSIRSDGTIDFGEFPAVTRSIVFKRDVAIGKTPTLGISGVTDAADQCGVLHLSRPGPGRDAQVQIVFTGEHTYARANVGDTGTWFSEYTPFSLVPKYSPSGSFEHWSEGGSNTWGAPVTINTGTNSIYSLAVHGEPRVVEGWITQDFFSGGAVMSILEIPQETGFEPEPITPDEQLSELLSWLGPDPDTRPQLLKDEVIVNSMPRSVPLTVKVDEETGVVKVRDGERYFEITDHTPASGGAIDRALAEYSLLTIDTDHGGGLDPGPAC